MRTIKLTHEEIEIIKSALEYVYKEKMEIVNKYKNVFEKKTLYQMIVDSDRYNNTQSVFNGERDV